MSTPEPEGTSTPPTADAFAVPALFTSPTADTVVVSCDQVEFRVHRLMLIEGSPFFRRMFEDAYPDPLYDPSHPSAQLERVPWPEPAHVVSILLTYIYPVPKPRASSLEELLTLLRIADKWEIPVALSLLKAQLLSPRFLDARPLRIYGFLCEMRLAEADELELVVRRCLERGDLREALGRGDLRGMSAEDYARLLDLRDSRAALAQSVVDRGIPATCPHGFSLTTANLVQRYKAILLGRLGKTPVGHAMHGVGLVGELLYPEQSNTCKICHPTESRRALLERFKNAKWEVDGLPATV